EYGHGVSTRLTGGPSQSGCLGNLEQMGEGWSDIMSLIMTAKTGDFANQNKGIGNYATSGGLNGGGIRRRPYTRDFTVNEFTYKNITVGEHDRGHIWASVNWDLYWNMADKYGYDPNFSIKTSGNNKAIQLIMDGMKLQPCRPGFIDGRNAILKADSVNNAAENSCLIWDTYARRGMGYKASQGTSAQVGDEIEDFESYPTCIGKILVDKTANFVVKPGDEITYTLVLRNQKPIASTNVNLIDIIPSGCTYVDGSASLPPSSVGGNTLAWNFNSLASLEKIQFTYKVKTDPSLASNSLYLDELNDGLAAEDRWIYDSKEGDKLWFLSPNMGIDDSPSWAVEESSTQETDLNLYMNHSVRLTGTDPSLLFYHNYNTQGGIDGGFIEISEDENMSFKRLEAEKFYLNGYTHSLDYQTFAIPFLQGFSGFSNGLIPSVVSLDEYVGKNVTVGFRFGTDDAGISTQDGFKGWVIDNVELINPYFYNSEACITSDQGDNTCVSLQGRGTLIESKKSTSSNDTETNTNSMKVYPNPASDQLFIKINSDVQLNELRFISTDGKILQSEKIISRNDNLFSVSTNGFPKGVVIVEAIATDRIYTKKVIIR
ncbi:MAG: M36 family metallopeptidase, partial [Bacteroidota bacterium]|nr:M36 family metallopeptidase [Bacteroidota bacterium]